MAPAPAIAGAPAQYGPRVRALGAYLVGYQHLPYARACETRSDLLGVNLSTGILIAHGWFYVVYLFSDFRLWSLMRWPFSRFILIALGGIVPFLSFFLEAKVGREVKAYLASRAERANTPTEVSH